MVNAVLTDRARGYKHPSYIGTLIAPIVPVDKLKAHYAIYGKEDFFLFNQLRGRGAKSNRMDLSNDMGDIIIRERDVEIPVPWEDDEEATVPVRPMLQAPRKAMRSLMLGLEHRCAQAFFDADTYGASNKVALTGNDRWDVNHDDSDPFADVATARSAIRSAIGMYPNTMAVGATVYEKLKVHPLVIERLKTTDTKVVTADLLATMFEVKRFLVGEAVGLSEGSTESDPFVDIWGPHALLCYTAEQEDADDGEPSFAYCFQRKGYPVTDEYRESSEKADVFRTTDKIDVHVVGPDAGYFIQNAITAS
jgi:hypothetical protein